MTRGGVDRRLVARRLIETRRLTMTLDRCQVDGRHDRSSLEPLVLCPNPWTNHIFAFYFDVYFQLLLPSPLRAATCQSTFPTTNDDLAPPSLPPTYLHSLAATPPSLRSVWA